MQLAVSMNAYVQLLTLPFWYMCIVLVLSSVYILIALGGPNKFLVEIHVRLSIQWKAKMPIVGYGQMKRERLRPNEFRLAGSENWY